MASENSETNVSPSVPDKPTNQELAAGYTAVAEDAHLERVQAFCSSNRDLLTEALKSTNQRFPVQSVPDNADDMCDAVASEIRKRGLRGTNVPGRKN